VFAAMPLLVSSCRVGPDYRRPTVEMPEAFKSAAPDDAAEPVLAADWWTLFNDPQLTELEAAAVQANPNLRAAAARVAQARAAARTVASQFYPVVSLDPSISRSRVPTNRGLATGTAAAAGGSTINNIQIPFDLSYEIDIWGRVRRSVESAQAQSLASAADFGVVLQTLTADVAQNYFTLRALDAQDVILTHSLDLYRRQIELTQTQFNAGLAGRTDILQAQTLLDAVQAQLIDARRQRADTEHALAILTGRPPSALSVTPLPLDGSPPPIPAGLPSDVLRRRPDVAEAEQNLVAANAAVGVARANFYPVVRLTGSAGYESIDVRHALDWESRVWSLGPSVSIPLFQGGKLTAQLEQAKARYDELQASFRGTVLTAFGEVEDALTDIHLRAQAAQAQDRAVESAREYLRLAELQYRQGLVGYLQVIDAERTLLSNELTALQLLSQRFISTALLIKALGGGWDMERTQGDPAMHAVGPVQ
jgi:multidrug efflux system outer membrane protein